MHDWLVGVWPSSLPVQWDALDGPRRRLRLQSPVSFCAAFAFLRTCLHMYKIKKNARAVLRLGWVKQCGEKLALK